MKILPSANIQAAAASCAAAVLDGAPGLVWYVRRHMRQHRQGLTIPQFRVLVKVQTRAEVSLSCMAEHLGCSLPTASRLVTHLVKRGYLTRSESRRDRRQLVLQATAQGRAIAQAARQGSLSQMEAEFAALSDADRAVVSQAMVILSDFVAGVRRTTRRRPRQRMRAGWFRFRSAAANCWHNSGGAARDGAADFS